MSGRTLTGKVYACLSTSESFRGDNAKDFGMLCFFPFKPSDTFFVVGVVDVAVEVEDEAAIVSAKVAMLREEARQIQAETGMRLTRIESQIAKLLAIEHQPTEPMVVDGGTAQARYASRDEAEQAL